MSKFQRPPSPLSNKEKERIAESFLDGAPRTTSEKETKSKRGKKGVIFLRVPQGLLDDLDRIYELTGYKPNMFCFQAIVEATKEKLKQLERDV